MIGRLLMADHIMSTSWAEELQKARPRANVVKARTDFITRSGQSRLQRSTGVAESENGDLLAHLDSRSAAVAVAGQLMLRPQSLLLERKPLQSEAISL